MTHHLDSIIENLTKKKKPSSIIVISKKEKNKNLLIYTAINQFLLDHNIRTPRLLSENYKKGERQV